MHYSSSEEGDAIRMENIKGPKYFQLVIILMDLLNNVPLMFVYRKIVHYIGSTYQHENELQTRKKKGNSKL